MLARDPAQRPTASECLSKWCKQVFPESFGSLLFHLGSAFQRLAYLYSDNRIALLRFHVDAIFKQCFDVDNATVSQKFYEPLEPTMYRLCKDDDTIARFQELVPKSFRFMGHNNNPDEEAKEGE